MRKSLLLLLTLRFLTSTASAQNVFFFPQLGDGTVADIVLKTTLIFVNLGAETTVKVQFFSTGDNPAPMSVTLGNLGTKAEFDITLPRGGSVSFQTPGTGALQVGYAKVTTASSSVGGTAVFTRLTPTGVVLYEAGVPMSKTLRDITVFVDSIADKDTGLALVNTGTATADITINLYDKEFNKIATTPVSLSPPLPPGAHRARFVNEIFNAFPNVAAQAREMEGTMTIQSNQPLAAVTLRTNDPGRPFPQSVPALTTFPVIEGRSDSGLAGSFSLLASGDAVVFLDLDPQKSPVIGAIYRLYEADSLVREVVRGNESGGTWAEVISIPRSTSRGTRVTRVQVQLIHPGSRLGATFDLKSL